MSIQGATQILPKKTSDEREEPVWIFVGFDINGKEMYMRESIFKLHHETNRFKYTCLMVISVLTFAACMANLFYLGATR